jgi:DNA-binding GntR family transcriptional regulator
VQIEFLAPSSALAKLGKRTRKAKEDLKMAKQGTGDAIDSDAGSSVSDVYDRLRRKILEHSIPPATKINIQQISEELGVSATPVREALRLLQGDNLLVATSNKGYATTEILNAQGVRDLFELRLLIEPWAARTAAANRLQNPGKNLVAEIKSFDSTSDSIQHAMIGHDSRFHRAILLSTENQTVIQAFEQSHCHLHLFRMFRDDWDWKTSINQHKEIAKAISNADPSAAEEAMRAHLNSAYLGFIEHMPKVPKSRALAKVAPSKLIQK